MAPKKKRAAEKFFDIEAIEESIENAEEAETMLDDNIEPQDSKPRAKSPKKQRASRKTILGAPKIAKPGFIDLYVERLQGNLMTAYVQKESNNEQVGAYSRPIVDFLRSHDEIMAEDLMLVRIGNRADPDIRGKSLRAQRSRASTWTLFIRSIDNETEPYTNPKEWGEEFVKCISEPEVYNGFAYPVRFQFKKDITKEPMAKAEHVIFHDDLAALLIDSFGLADPEQQKTLNNIEEWNDTLSEYFDDVPYGLTLIQKYLDGFRTQFKPKSM